ncbi:unnamed protein product [Rhizophagus irregularis]|uniref:Uncharacterized protein n=1 Tax=Rhizophagus irregularis TaxID=588596 RepID=A0A915Z890_9GLOM|nr:unnamed protein product [Rhizophagus irregularis]
MIELNDDELNCEQDIYQDENLQESIIFNNRESIWNNEFIDENILPIRKAATIPTTVPILKKAVHKRNLYGRVWGLARTATLLAVEQKDNEITIILQDYIRRKSNQNTPEMSSALDERPTIDERPAVDATDEIFSNPQEMQINDSDTNFILNRSQIEEDETEKERKINNINI